MKPTNAPWQPLAGLRVLDFSLLLPGPFATLALADLGAEVIKIEAPQGDMVRKLPMAMFRMANRNKRAMALDMKHPEARAVIARLARWADFSIEGFRPGVARRLGIDHETLRAINPRLICCSLSGYGQTGPSRNAPGHELNYLASAGSFALPGHWGEPARRQGIPLADLTGGAFAAIAMLAALHERERTGQGVYLDLSLQETALAITTIRPGLDVDGEFRGHLWPTNDIFETADGRVLVLGLVEDHLWANFVRAVGDLAPDLASGHYATDPERRAHGDVLHARLHEVMALLPLDAWMKRFAGHDIPVEPILTPAQATRSEHVVAREMVMERDGERHIPFPVHADGRRGAALRSLAPEIGEHNREVLNELGYASGEIDAFTASGLFGKSAG